MTQCAPSKPIQKLVEFGLKKTQLRNAYVKGMMELLDEVDPCIFAINEEMGKEVFQTIDGAPMRCAIHRVLAEVYEWDKQHLLDSEKIVGAGIPRTETKHFKEEMERQRGVLKQDSLEAEMRIPLR